MDDFISDGSDIELPTDGANVRQCALRHGYRPFSTPGGPNVNNLRREVKDRLLRMEVNFGEQLRNAELARMAELRQRDFEDHRRSVREEIRATTTDVLGRQSPGHRIQNSDNDLPSNYVSNRNRHHPRLTSTPNPVANVNADMGSKIKPDTYDCSILGHIISNNLTSRQSITTGIMRQEPRN